MTKTTSPPGGDAVGKTSDSKSPKSSHHHPQGVGRETVESIAFAFVLALLFRSFVAEAFVIPTGSMAPTLYGRNKDIVCPACGHGYAIGASDELDEESGSYLIPSRRIEESMCPNCRHLHDVKSVAAFKGDRILVNKSSYQFGEPDRWDVIVFRYPEDTQKNYIKRLVGLPGEALRVERGDVYARKGAGGEFQILRKQDPNKQKLLQHVVYDDRHPPLELLKSGWPESWQPVTNANAGANADAVEVGGWKHDPQARRFELTAADQPQTVRYAHLVPSPLDWRDVEDGKPVRKNPRPQLVSDFCGYNAYTGGRAMGLDDDRFWVGDLTLTCAVRIVSVSGPNSVLTLELREGVRRYRCRIDVATGEATLLRNDEFAADPDTAPEIELARAQTSIKRPGSYTLRFANVDDRLCLWVNDNWLSGGLVSTGTFEAPPNRRPQESDLTPAAFSAQGMTVAVSDLLIERDLYYRAESVPNEAGNFSNSDHEIDENYRLRELLDDPQKWGEVYEGFARKGGAEFHELGSDEFFVMGDNSPRSQDSRLWPNQVRRAVNRHAVNRQALIGKAFFIYWPHGVPFLNGGKGITLLSHKSVPRPEPGNQFERDIAKAEANEAAEYPEYSIPFYPQWWRWKRIR